MEATPRSGAGATSEHRSGGRARRVLARIPRGIWAPVVVAIVNAVVWAVVTPSFQVVDEPAHAAYVQYLAETGKVPRPIAPQVGAITPHAEDEETAFRGVPFTYVGIPRWDADEARAVQRKLDDPKLGRVSEIGAGAAANNPPLYYAVEALPYLAFSGSSYFDRLLAMRLFSALFAGLTAAFTFLFLREVMPARPWTWTVGALAVALLPLLGAISGGVNPDALLWSACAALFWLLARAFRRGLSPGVGAGIGAATVAGLLTKGAMLGLVPGVVVGVAALVLRAPKPLRRRALAGAAVAVAMVALPYVSWLVVSDVAYHRGGAATTGGVATSGVDYAEEFSYVWQVYLPRLPFMDDQFGDYPLWNAYFQGFVGRFGYFQYGFRGAVNWLALAVAAGLLALFGTLLVRRRRALRARFGETLTYAAMVAGLLVSLGIAGYQFREREGLPFEAARYLLLILPLYGLLVALAVRSLGRRWGPALGGVFVVLACLHEVAAILMTLARYYA